MLEIDYTTHLSPAKNFRQRFLVLHYTALNFADSVVALKGDVSAHYLVPTLKSIDSTYPLDKIVAYSLVSEEQRAWHAGVSDWKDRSNLNDTAIGIEIVNMATDTEFVPFADEQIDVVIKLCKNILARYPDITPTNVVAHGDIAVGRKMDPGALFPWKKLYDNGIGAWYDDETVEKYKTEFAVSIPTPEDVANKLRNYGYKYDDADLGALFRIFQMHFRNSKYDGILDIETAAIAYALVEKYVDLKKKK
ncbi:MAG: N-acetylmuramoyl-L-alanine amidase [Alphaproteobacteria bacterium]|jgi:N-acetylmuramoyl-L-alanine amidase|nr:N-acetylmuramoyl-L-alanine amidase [Alphaproteobacteria bacterium]